MENHWKVKVVILLILLYGCNMVDDERCDPEVQKELNQIKEYLEEEFTRNEVKGIVSYEVDQVYRLRVSNSWTSGVYLTIFQENDKYFIECQGYSELTKSYKRRLIQLERYEWAEFIREFKNIDFWCRSPEVYEEIIQGGPDGTWYTLEGLHNGKYHIIIWAFAHDKERLISLLVKLGKVEKLEPSIRKLDRGDSLIYNIYLDNTVNTKDIKLVLDNGDTLNSEYLQIEYKIAKKDSLKIRNSKLIQYTSDGMINELQFGEPKFKFRRNLERNDLE